MSDAGKRASGNFFAQVGRQKQGTLIKFRSECYDFIMGSLWQQGGERMSKRDVRADVLQAVCDVCCKHGLEHLTTKKLGEEARCSEAMIYYHFKSKQEILEATFLHIHGEIDAVFREHFIARGLVLERDTYNVCVETWMLYYGYWRDHPAQRAFYDAFIHSHYITNELWLRDNASYVFFTSMFGKPSL